MGSNDGRPVTPTSDEPKQQRGSPSSVMQSDVAPTAPPPEELRTPEHKPTASAATTAASSGGSAGSGPHSSSTPPRPPRTPPKQRRPIGLPSRDLAAEFQGNDGNGGSGGGGKSRGGSNPHGTTLSSIASGDLTEREVPYGGGATELFRAIEDCRWDDAVRLCRERPEQAGVWVKSSGTENTTFDWSVWRRLPIHEACRRQPPPILISSLLTAYPLGASQKTHFGEMPLHLAVGCGSNPETINLLLVAHPPAASHSDDAGRTPPDLVHDGVLPEDRAVIRGSLDRCLAFSNRQERLHKSQLDDIGAAHAEEVDRLAREHKRRLAVKDMALAELAREVKRGTERLEAAASEADDRDREIQRRVRAERALTTQVQNLEDEISRLRGKNRDLKGRVADLDGTVLRQEGTIERLNGRVEDLTSDLRRVCSLQEELVNVGVKNVEDELVRMIRTQKTFLNRVRDQRDAVRTILSERDVAVPPPPPPQSPPSPGIDKNDSSGDDSTGSASSARSNSSESKFKALATRSRRPMHQPPQAAAEKVREEGATKKAAESATAFLKREMIELSEVEKEIKDAAGAD